MLMVDMVSLPRKYYRLANSLRASALQMGPRETKRRRLELKLISNINVTQRHRPFSGALSLVLPSLGNLHRTEIILILSLYTCYNGIIHKSTVIYAKEPRLCLIVVD